MGCTFIAYRCVPHRSDQSRETTLITDWEAGSATAAFTLLQEQLLFGPADAFAADVLSELEREPADVVAVNDGL